ncbi:MAG: chorismate synthase [Firmicutes bacterium]|nr:chorismate synthase [Bacillota bacterium]
MLRYLTAGESHGKGYLGILDGLPSGIVIDQDFVLDRLKKRREAIGRGERKNIEQDVFEFFGGVHQNKTTGAPLGVLIPNKDVWTEEQLKGRLLDCVRPGHADFVGAKKYATEARIVSERASARHTIASVVLGAVCRLALLQLGIQIKGEVVSLGNLALPTDQIVENLLRECAQKGTTVGGEVRLTAHGVPLGIGSCMQHDQRCEYALAANLMSINAVKGVEIGLGFEFCKQWSADKNFVDEIYAAKDGVVRKTNFAGGIEGGMTNGEDIVVTLAFKPIPSQKRGVQTIHIKTKEMCHTKYERSDLTAVFAGQVIAEDIFAFVLFEQLLKHLGGDTMGVVQKRLNEQRVL